jgi:hypothetical protein
MTRTVWVFVSSDLGPPAGVFSDRRLAEAWIRKYALSGVLTEYPVDVGIYDWVIANGFWKPTMPSHETPRFIGRFTSAYLNHQHFENGESASSNAHDDSTSIAEHSQKKKAAGQAVPSKWQRHGLILSPSSVILA